jgi:hypothetical protein
VIQPGIEPKRLPNASVSADRGNIQAKIAVRALALHRIFPERGMQRQLAIDGSSLAGGALGDVEIIQDVGDFRS